MLVILCHYLGTPVPVSFHVLRPIPWGVCPCLPRERNNLRDRGRPPCCSLGRVFSLSMGFCADHRCRRFRLCLCLCRRCRHRHPWRVESVAMSSDICLHCSARSFWRSVMGSIIGGAGVRVVVVFNARSSRAAESDSSRLSM